jgi:putative methyltransferase
MKNIYFFNPQSLSAYDGKVGAYLPYNIACLWAYANAFDHIKQNFTLKEIYVFKNKIDDVSEELEDPVICGFSCFVWNWNYNKALASKIKERWPNCTIVFGGPHITKETLTDYSFVDVIILGEGEILFKDFLDDHLNGTFKSVYDKQRIPDLSILPSPYTDTDIFDRLIEQYPNFAWQTMLETNRGCPYSCTFCDWASVTNSKIYQLPMERIQKEVDWIIKKNSTQKHIRAIAITDANFGILKERDLEIAKILKTTIDIAGIDDIALSYTKTYNTHLFEIAKILNLPTGLTLSFQSNNKDTLIAIKRKNLNEFDLHKLLDFANENNITHEQEYILGLPLETKESWYEGQTELLDIGQHKVFDIFFCSILPNTELSTEESRKKYKLETILTPELKRFGLPDYILKTVGKEASDFEEVDEWSEMIRSTSTMSQTELIESYMFSLLLIHAHCQGYTYIISRIAARYYDISYLDFYRKLEQNLYVDEIFRDHLNSIKNSIDEIFSTGISTNPVFQEQGRFDYMSFKFFFMNKDRLIDIATNVLNSFVDSESLDHVKDLQKTYAYDLRQTSIEKYCSPFDLDTFEFKPTYYKVTPRITRQEFVQAASGLGANLNTLAQKQLLVNSFTKISKNNTIEIKKYSESNITAAQL